MLVRLVCVSWIPSNNMVAGGGVYPRSVCSRNSEIGTPSTGSLLLTAKISAIVPSKPCRVNGKEVPLASAALPRVPPASPIKIAVFVLAGPLVHAPNAPREFRLGVFRWLRVQGSCRILHTRSPGPSDRCRGSACINIAGSNSGSAGQTPTTHPTATIRSCARCTFARVNRPLTVFRW
jgi:hypothetical protein